jgi:hypothetical protein
VAVSEFQRVLTEAVADISANGYDSAARLEDWLLRLRIAAERDGVSDADVADALKRTLGTTYKRLVDNGGLERSAGVSRFTIERVRPELRAELDRRILASANLIKLNREQMVDKTLQRFSGWATSVPPGGSRAVDRREVKKAVRKALASEPFEVRRVTIDQGHKLAANLNQVVAEGNGAIAIEWKSRWREAGYNYRKDHKERDGHVYALRGNWALEKGLMKPGPDGYYDQITSVGEEPFCRCSGVYLFSLRDLPADMVTAKGRAEMERVRGLIAAE